MCVSANASDWCSCPRVDFTALARWLLASCVHSVSTLNTPFGSLCVHTLAPIKKEPCTHSVDLALRSCVCMVWYVSTVRECRGAQAIGHDNRERIVTKFDLAWKNLLIGHIVASAPGTAAHSAAHNTADGVVKLSADSSE